MCWSFSGRVLGFFGAYWLPPPHYPKPPKQPPEWPTQPAPRTKCQENVQKTSVVGSGVCWTCFGRFFDVFLICSGLCFGVFWKFLKHMGKRLRTSPLHPDLRATSRHSRPRKPSRRMPEKRPKNVQKTSNTYHDVFLTFFKNAQKTS